jgi:muramidase (phage lysozyme)
MSEAYNPYDPVQTAFLSTLALGETGSAGTGALFEGVGSTASNPIDLSSNPVDQYGFPVWSGTGNSHAAGIFQFQPSTWDTIAAANGLNFANVSDQDQGAWILAQQTYAQQTNGGDLETALQAGNYSQIATALEGQWPSLTAASLSAGGGPQVSGGNVVSANTLSGGSSDSGAASSGLFGFITTELQRFGVLLIGGLVVIVALWYVLSQTTGVPSPTEVAKGAGEALAAA